MNDTNTINLIPCDVECFIIPQDGHIINPDVCFAEDMIKGMKAICEANGQTFDPLVDKVVHIWFTCPDLKCENMTDHIFEITDPEDGTPWYGRLNYTGRIPVKLLQGHKEGDTFTFNYPTTLSKNLHIYNFVENELPVIFQMNLTLAQRKYRYRTAGDFETVLEKVCQ